MIPIVILVDVLFPIAEQIRFQALFQVNAVNDVSRWSTHKPSDSCLDDPKPFKINELLNRKILITNNTNNLKIPTTNNTINHNTTKEIVLMSTSSDPMMALEFRLDKASILIVKLFHPTIKTPSHVGHDQAISHSHTKHRAQISPVTVKSHVSQSQMPLRATPVATNAALAQVIQLIKLPLIYK